MINYERMIKINENNYIGIATDELYRAFEVLNKEYFSNKLEYPMITIQKSRRNNLGWFTLGKVWEDKENSSNRYEINISAGHLNNEVNNIVGVLLHEMVHYANRVADVKDCNGQIHNKKFKNLAEAVGLIVEKCKQYGYGLTSCSDELNNFITNNIKPDEKCFSYFRCDFELPGKEKKPREKSTYTYICPQCGEKVKAKRDKNIICGECECEFEMEEE